MVNDLVEQQLLPADASSRASHRLPTLPVAGSQIATNILMIVFVFLFPGVCEPGKSSPSCLVNPFSMLIYSHTVHWTLHLMADQYLKRRHKLSRQQGYIEFYLDTKNLRRTPFYLVSVGNAVLLVTVTALQDYCDNGSSSACADKFTKVDSLRGLITLECMIIATIWVAYILKVRDFHRKSQPPDIYRPDFVQLVCPGHTLGLSEEDPASPSLSQVMEKQAELISYMHEHVDKLKHRLSQLTSADAGFLAEV